MAKVRFGQKTIACLLIAEAGDAPTGPMYRKACEWWSEKAVIRKFEELDRRGYLEVGVSARTGPLTEKGRKAIEELRANL